MDLVLQSTLRLLLRLGEISAVTTMGRVADTMALNVEDQSEINHRPTLTPREQLSKGRLAR